MNKHARPSCTAASRGFTLVELLVVIAIIGVLVGIMIPSIQAMREIARRSSCQQNLVRIGFALAAYHDRHLQYPAGTINDTGPIRSVAEGYHHNWLAALMPHLDAVVVAERIDSDHSVYAPENQEVRSLRIPVLLCPSASQVAVNTTCYAGIHHSTEAPIDEGNDGVFILNRPTRNSDITDGLSYTLFVGEKLTDRSLELGWISGTRSSLRNTGHAINALDGNLPLRELPEMQGERAQIFDENDDDFDFDDADPVEAETPRPETPAAPEQSAADRPLFVGGLQSHHPGGAHTLSGGGEIVFRADSTDQRVLQQMANKSDGELPEEMLGVPVVEGPPVEARGPRDRGAPGDAADAAPDESAPTVEDPPSDTASETQDAAEDPPAETQPAADVEATDVEATDVEATDVEADTAT